MQDLASEFSKHFRRWYPGPSQWEGATPSRTQHPARPMAERRAQSPRCLGPKPWSPSTFQAWLRPSSLCADELIRQLANVYCWKCLQGQRSKVKVRARSNSLLKRRLTFRRCGIGTRLYVKAKMSLHCRWLVICSATPVNVVARMTQLPPDCTVSTVVKVCVSRALVVTVRTSRVRVTRWWSCAREGRVDRRSFWPSCRRHRALGTRVIRGICTAWIARWHLRYYYIIIIIISVIYIL